MPGKQHMARGRIMVVSRAKIAFLLSFYIAAVNFPLIDSFNRETAEAAANPTRLVRRRPAGSHRAIPYVDRGRKTASDTRRRRSQAPTTAPATS